jgi:hypothetical protein
LLPLFIIIDVIISLNLSSLSLSVLSEECRLHRYLSSLLIIVVHVLNEFAESTFVGITDLNIILGHEAL